MNDNNTCNTSECNPVPCESSSNDTTDNACANASQNNSESCSSTSTSVITPDMIISDVLNKDKGAAPVFYANGLFCLGCPSASGESIKDACEIHGIDCNKLINELNEYFSKNSTTNV